MVMRWKLCQEIALFYLAIFLLVIGGSSTSPQIMNETESPSVGDPCDAVPSNTPATTNSDVAVDVLIQNWRGFATKDDESHPTRLNVETIRTLEPDEARRLLASNISIEEVKSQTRSGDRDAILRGGIRLNNDSYRLIDIILKPADNKSTMEATIASSRSSSGSGNVAATVGHVVMTISMVDGVEVAEGHMVIDDSPYIGAYRLLLNKCLGQGPRGRGPRAGVMGRR